MISSYECDYMTADAEFLLSRPNYKGHYGPGTAADADATVLSDPPVIQAGRDHPEEANQVGYETAMRWTKGQLRLFRFATHTDRQHIHNPSTTTPLRWIAPTSFRFHRLGPSGAAAL